jgi:hypothetical protein
MKGWMMAAVLGLAASAGGARTAAPRETKPVWQTDYARARAEARRTGKPLFVVFRCQP